MIISRVLQATGNMKIPMFSQLIGAATNIILEPIMIFGLLGFLKKRVAVAALTTVTNQILSMIFVLTMFKLKKQEVEMSLKGYKPKKKYIVNIYKIGIPTTVMNAIYSLTTTLMNGIVVSFSQTAVAVLGIYLKLQSLIFMPVVGLSQGAIPIMGYNFGANN